VKSKDRSGEKLSITVGEFFEKAQESLSLELVAGGDGMDNRIIEAAINRPGLALTGFYEYFAWKRIQTFGFAENKYVDSLSLTSRGERLRAFFGSKIPCVVMARNKKIPDEIVELADEFKVPVFRTKMVTKHFMNAATILMENLMSPTAKIQGTMIEFMGIGVLIEGKPGMGKSDTALSLVKKGAALVADDITKLRVDSLSGALLGSAIDLTRYHMEIKGVGIIHVPSLFGVASVRSEKVLNLIVTLCKKEDIDDSISLDDKKPTREILGVNVRNVQVAVVPGRDIANVVEVATLDYKLKMLGHDAAKELDDRLIDVMSGGRGVYR
jgi:HPr kinase/phosphorylase